MDNFSIITNIINTAATCAIAFYAYASNALTKELKNQDKDFRNNQENLTKQHQQELSDLYQALVIATLMAGSSNTGKTNELIRIFNAHYKGTIKIFDKKEGYPG